LSNARRPPFTLVAGHHVGLDLHAPGHAFGLAHRQQIVAGEEVVLGHLAAPAAHLARRQRGQRIEIADDAAGLPIRTDQVLALDAG
jgi:hypothetical protein